MTDMELLNAIGELFEKKFGEKFDEVFEKKIEPGFRAIEKRLDKVEERLDKVEARLDKVEERLDKVEERLGKAENDITVIRRDIEYKVYPLMDNIWSNYMDTFKRYQRNNEKLEITYTDIDALKSAVEQHTVQIAELQKRIEPALSTV